jgi:hypothetical protein
MVNEPLEPEYDAEHGRVVAIESEDDFHRFLIDVLYRVGQFADFGPHDAQRPAILEDIAILRGWTDQLPTAVGAIWAPEEPGPEDDSGAAATEEDD